MALWQLEPFGKKAKFVGGRRAKKKVFVSRWLNWCYQELIELGTVSVQGIRTLQWNPGTKNIYGWRGEFKSDSQIGPENFHSDKSQNNVMIGPYDSP